MHHFGVSQQATAENTLWENATDIHINNFNINAGSKNVLEIL